MKTSFFQLFKDALYHPKKHAAYRLLSIGKTIQYLFILITIVTICSFIKFTFSLGNEADTLHEITPYLNDIKWLLYPLAFLFLFIMNTAFLFIRVSFYAFIGLFLLKLLQRRGEYRMLWRTATFSMSLGYLLTTGLSFFLPSTFWLTLLGFVLTVSYLVIAVRKYPVQPKVKTSVSI